MNRHGSSATAAYGAVTQVVNYVQFPALSIAITASILGAQAIGAGKFERVRAILRTGLWLNAAITGSLVLLGYALSHWLLGLFITQPEVRAQAEHLLHIMLWSLLLFGFQAVVGGIMRASGVVLVPVAISIGCIALVQLPAAYALSAALRPAGRVDGVPASPTRPCWCCRRPTTSWCGSSRSSNALRERAADNRAREARQAVAGASSKEHPKGRTGGTSGLHRTA